MRYDELASVEERWRRRSLFRAKPRRRWGVVAWMVVAIVVAIGAVLVMDVSVTTESVSGLFSL